MLNPNIEMLENLISAAVSTRYKEVPPTEEEFLTLAQSMRATLSTLPVTDEEFAEILVRLRASIVIQMDVGVYINDRNTPHKSWLPSRRADLDFFFWNRYKKYLKKLNIGIQGLPQRWIRFLTRSSICSEIRKVKNLFSAADWCWAMSNPAKPQITPQSATKLLILGTELLLFLQE